MSNRPPRGRQKPRKETSPSPPLKVVVRRLPPNLPENIFHTSIANWHKVIDWSDYVAGKLATSRLEKDKFSRAYLKFRKHADCLDFIKKYHGHLFRSGEGKEYRACAEVAPFQKVAKPLSNAAKAKDTLVGTIEQDPDYIEFLESLKTVTPHEKEEVVVQTKITPLIEHLRVQKAKNEEKAKARKAKESATKGKQQEEKRKAAQAKADADTAKLKEKAAATGKGKRGKSSKETIKKDEGQADADVPKSAKTARSKAADKSSKSGEASAPAMASVNGNASSKRATPSAATTKPSPLAQQRMPKAKPGETSNPQNGDVKARSKKSRKSQAKASNNDTKQHSATKLQPPVDISGPTPAEMAALSKAKT